MASVSNLLYFWGLRYIRSRDQLTLKRSSVTSSGAGSSRTSPAVSRPHSRRASPPGEQQQPPAISSGSTAVRSGSFTCSTRAAALGKPPSGSLRNAPTQQSSSVAARERDAGRRKFASISKIASKLRSGFRAGAGAGASPSRSSGSPSSPSAGRRSSSPHSTLYRSSSGLALAFSGGFRPLSAAYQHPSVEELDGSHAHAGSPGDTRSLVSSPDPDAAAHDERASIADSSLAALDSGSGSDSDEESASLDSELYLQPVHFLRY